MIRVNRFKKWLVRESAPTRARAHRPLLSRERRCQTARAAPQLPRTHSLPDAWRYPENLPLMFAALRHNFTACTMHYSAQEEADERDV